MMKLYNTLTRSKDELVPIEPGKIKIYVCGPTVYDYIHVGNARAFVVFDVLRRFLTFLNFEVTYVMNLTDIDDRIIERALTEGLPTERITQKYTQAFFDDLDALGVLPADVYPKATDHLNEIKELIQQLVNRGFAYELEGDVYYDVNKFEEYGKLSGKKLDELVAGSRVDVDKRKRNPSDFALWKSQKPGEPGWDSPWGVGRPGWHVECSAMSMKYLGESFDIHAGGTDLIFPHHENEIAQSEAATGRKFVNHWLHNGFLQIEGTKMAKSLGNFKRVKDIVNIYPGVVIRLFFLQKHYRGPMDFTQEGLDAAKNASERLNIFYRNLKNVSEGEGPVDSDVSKLQSPEAELVSKLQELKTQFVEAMQDDLNTPVAVSVLFEMVRETNKSLSKSTLSEGERFALAWASDLFEELNTVLGVFDGNQKESNTELVEGLMTLIIQLRRQLRVQKEWELADKIRDELTKIGIVLEDRAEETTWRMK